MMLGMFAVGEGLVPGLVPAHAEFIAAPESSCAATADAPARARRDKPVPYAADAPRQRRFTAETIAPKDAVIVFWLIPMP